MRFLLLGDTHGNDKFFERACQAATESGCDRIFQLGDFGYWEHYPEGVRYLDAVRELLEEYGLTCVWIDGNHENHPLLWEKYRDDCDLSHTGGFWTIRAGLFYAPRGLRWAWDGITFLALGGAYSIDREYRTPGKSWWGTEMITDEDVIKASAGGPVDVMLTHDAPNEADIPSLRRQDPLDYPQSRNNREMVSEVVRQTRPQFLAHGHYHDRYSDILHYPVGVDGDGRQLLHSVQVEGLGADMDPIQESSIIFDTAKFKEIQRSG